MDTREWRARSSWVTSYGVACSAGRGTEVVGAQTAGHRLGSKGLWAVDGAEVGAGKTVPHHLCAGGEELMEKRHGPVQAQLPSALSFWFRE